jgi:hypothetical protein
MRLGSMVSVAGIVMGGAASLRAQAVVPTSSRLEGVVVDTAGRPIASAQVTILHTMFTQLTDSAGKFQLRRLAAGETRFSVRRLGYYPGDFDVMLPADSALIVTIHLTPAAILVDSILTDAPRGDMGLDAVGFSERMLQRKIGGGNSTFITEEDIERRHPDRPSDLLITVPGVRLAYERDTAIPRGRGGCLMNVWVDGHFMNPYLYPALSGGAGGTFARGGETARSTVGHGDGLDALIGPHEIAGIEIYPSPSEVPFRFDVMNSGCGAIIIWTK